MKITQILSRDSWTSNRAVNKGYPKYGARMLIILVWQMERNKNYL